MICVSSVRRVTRQSSWQRPALPFTLAPCDCSFVRYQPSLLWQWLPHFHLRHCSHRQTDSPGRNGQGVGSFMFKQMLLRNFASDCVVWRHGLRSLRMADSRRLFWTVMLTDAFVFQSKSAASPNIAVPTKRIFRGRIIYCDDLNTGCGDYPFSGCHDDDPSRPRVRCRLRWWSLLTSRIRCR